MTDTDEIAARLRKRLDNASPADRMYERPVSWDDARALLDEREALIHDVERHIAIASEEASRAEAADAELARLRAVPEGEVGEVVAMLRSFGTDEAETAADLITRQAAEIEIGLRAEAMLRDDLRRTEDARIATEASLREAVDLVMDLSALVRRSVQGPAQQAGILAEADAFFAKMEPKP